MSRTFLPLKHPEEQRDAPHPLSKLNSSLLNAWILTLPSTTQPCLFMTKLILTAPNTTRNERNVSSAYSHSESLYVWRFTITWLLDLSLSARVETSQKVPKGKISRPKHDIPPNVSQEERREEQQSFQAEAEGRLVSMADTQAVEVSTEVQLLSAEHMRLTHHLGAHCQRKTGVG